MEKFALSMFAGLGATAFGQLQQGKDVLAIEREEAMVATLRANAIPTIQADVKDIGDFTTFIDREVDVVLGGPPCQPFSQAGKQTGEYDPRDCIPDFIRAVDQLRPRLFVMEEVKTLTWARNRPYLDRVLSDLRSLGYDVDFRVLDASHYGVGQARKRLFVVGRLDGSVQWPEPTTREYPPTMGGILGWTPADAWLRNQQAPEPARVAYYDPHWSWVFERPSTTVVGSFRPDVQAAPGYRKKGDGPRQNSPGSVVTTLEERLLLQDMPPSWIVKGSKASQDLQVGNSCPPILTMSITSANESQEDKP